MLADECEQGLAALDSDRLEVLGLGRGVHCLDSLLETPPRARNVPLPFFLEIGTTELCDADLQAEVEGQSCVNFGEVVLRVQVHRIGNHPPAALLALNVIELIGPTKDSLRPDLLDELGGVVTIALAVDVFAYVPRLVLRQFWQRYLLNEESSQPISITLPTFLADCGQRPNVYNTPRRRNSSSSQLSASLIGSAAAPCATSDRNASCRSSSHA